MQRRMQVYKNKQVREEENELRRETLRKEHENCKTIIQHYKIYNKKTKKKSE